MGTVLIVIGTGMRSSWDELVSCKRALTIGVNCSMCEVMKWLEDLSKAYDSLPHQLLIAKLQAYGLDEYSCLLLMDYLQCRQKRVKVGDTVSPWEHISRGAPQESVLGPLHFNIFMNDLCYFIKRVKLNAYADDQHLYDSDIDHIALYSRLDSEPQVTVKWFKVNGLMANLEKFKLLIFGETNVDFSFEMDGKRIKRSSDIDLLSMNIYSKLDFGKHVSTICEKANKQVQVIKRFRNLVPQSTRARLSCFCTTYLSILLDMWHFCGIRSSQKLELVNKKALRSVLGDASSTYPELLTKAGLKTLEYNMIVTVYKCKN